MSPGEVEAFFRVYIQKVWNEKDDAAFERMVVPDIGIRGFEPRGDVTRTQDEMRESRRQYLAMFPDLQVNIERVMVDGDEVIGWCACVGTAQPEEFAWDGPPKTVSFDVCIWGRVRDGKFVDGKNLVDFGAIREGLTGINRMDF